MSEMKSLASFSIEEYHDRILSTIKIRKRDFINGIRGLLPEYISKLKTKYDMDYQSGNNRNSIGFSFNEHFNTNYNFLNSDENYRNSSNDAKDTVKTGSNNIKTNNILASDDSYPVVNDDLDENPKFSEQNTKDIFNDTNDDILNANISKDDSNNTESKNTIPNKQDIPKKKRRKKIKSIDANTSTNTTNTTENINTSNLNGIDSKEEGEISQNFSIDSLDDSNAPPTTIPKINNNLNLSNKFDIEEESIGDGFSSEGKIVSNNSNRPALNNNNSKKITLFDFGEFGKNDDDPAAFSDVI